MAGKYYSVMPLMPLVDLMETMKSNDGLDKITNHLITIPLVTSVMEPSFGTETNGAIWWNHKQVSCFCLFTNNLIAGFVVLHGTSGLSSNGRILCEGRDE